ncbi:signal transduction histidine kinase [Legionella adelaidensis]|uniref:histidine kinase n=1 Tax=Legionella adelaidensis TaxID=45056 RepID=A0A0W0R6H3_9GAMM|nr:HAMP domain-containing sensor histidine kinase [Legionella adelaidensis]KTC66619.1 signal transduction histidine kinase [Legionella adelaidensis]VEH81061.1 signal transduction histidine kinase [Legionella adelaidensis]
MYATYSKQELEDEITKLKNKTTSQNDIIHRQSKEIHWLTAELKKKSQYDQLFYKNIHNLLFDNIHFLFQNCIEATALLDSHLNLIIFNNSFEKVIPLIFSTQINYSTNFKLVIATCPKLEIKIISACEQLSIGQKKNITIENSPDKIEELYHFELTIHKLQNTKKEIEYIFSLQDFSEYKRNEIRERKEQVQFARMAKQKALKELSATIAHELIQPLTAIKTYCYGALLQAKKNPQKTIDFTYPLEKIALHSSHAAELVNRLRNFMKEETLFLNQTNLHELIKKALNYLFYESNHPTLIFTFDLDERIPEAMLDGLKIMQLFINLGRNSIEALQDTKEAHPKIYVKTEWKNNIIHVNFRDNGPGIPPYIQERLLHTPYTTKSQGMGLGLSICRAIVQSHGGIFQVKQHKEKGAWFYFTLSVKG